MDSNLNDSDISGATSSTYTLVAGDADTGIKVRVSFTDDRGNTESPTTESALIVTAANSPATGAPTISGTAQVGETLAASTTGITDSDGLTSATFTYQWLADDAAISGATGSTYTLVAANAGKTVKVQVSFTDDAGNTETLTSAATAAVTAANTPASGTARVGETLTGQQPRHRRAHHQRHGAGGRDPDRLNLEHRRCGRRGQRNVHVPVAGRRR